MSATARERIDAAARQAGWTATPWRGAWINTIEYRRGRDYVRVQYDALERARDATTRRLNLPRARTADHVLGYLYGYLGARFEYAKIGSVCTVVDRHRPNGWTVVRLRFTDGTESWSSEVDLHKLVGRHLGSEAAR